MRLRIPRPSRRLLVPALLVAATVGVVSGGTPTVSVRPVGTP
ncbi:MAG: hypothetical protein JWL78_1109, partial [Chloroflexi bacterium]|nr:hypothetical protein [Chloroflexota bacterium]